MEQTVADSQQQTTSTLTPSANPPARDVAFGPTASAVSPQACSNCGAVPAANGGPATPPSWVYAIGRIEPRFPSISVEKEFAQATGREKTSGLTDRQALHAILGKHENRYLVRQLCWVMTIEGLETYLLRPRDPADFAMLVEAVRPNPSSLDLDVVIGIKGPVAPPEMCNGLMVPIVVFDQIYSFDRQILIASINKDKPSTKEKDFEYAADEVFGRVAQMTNNAGAMDEHRALNYLSVRYQAIYARTHDAFRNNNSLTAVDVRPSTLSGTRNLLDVIFSYTHRSTDVVDKWSVRVDVTDEFPFLVTKLSPYYDR